MMVVLDATILLHVLFEHIDAPLDANGIAISKCKERVEFLLKNLSEARTQVIVPTPVLAEVLVLAGHQRAAVLAAMSTTYALKIEPFCEMAAVECAELLDADKKARKAKRGETKAKLKFDRQIIAIAKVHKVHTIFSDDGHFAAVARANGIHVIGLQDLQLPPVPPQMPIEFPEAGGDSPDAAEKG